MYCVSKNVRRVILMIPSKRRRRCRFCTQDICRIKFDLFLVSKLIFEKKCNVSDELQLKKAMNISKKSSYIIKMSRTCRV